MKKTLMKVIISVGIGIGGVGLAVFAAILIAAPMKAGANPRFQAQMAETATATTTIQGMTPGTGTTTPLDYNAYTNSGNTIPSALALEIQFSASTSQVVFTSAILQWQIEYGTAAANGVIDYFGEDQAPTNITNGQQVSHIYHSTTTPFHSWTISTAANATTTLRKIVPIKPLTQHTRVTFSNGLVSSKEAGNATSTQTAVWARFVPIKESSY